MKAEPDANYHRLIAQLHEAACRAGERCYRDPVLRVRVFTASYLQSRGSCCGGSCRHCPFIDECGTGDGK